jgi:hypothetical protein
MRMLFSIGVLFAATALSSVEANPACIEQLREARRAAVKVCKTKEEAARKSCFEEAKRKFREGKKACQQKQS